MLDDDKIYVGKYYELTEEDINEIANVFNERGLNDVLDFCRALSVAVSCKVWNWAEEYLKEVGSDQFLRSCNNCASQTTCDPDFALNVCGALNNEWREEK